MAICDYCGERIEGLPFKCKYCGGTFCVKHHLPENHECPGLHKAKSLYIIEYEEKRAQQEKRPSYGPTMPIPRLSLFYPGEILELGIAFIAVVAAMAYPWILRPNGLIVILLATALAFLPHELAHKLAAQTLGFPARFTLSRLGLIVTLLSAFSPLKLIMPGYVRIMSSYLNKRASGLVSLAGPAVNIAVGLASLFIPLYTFRNIILSLSSIIAIINLVPLDGLDGAKIISWNPIVWGATTTGALALYILSLL